MTNIAPKALFLESPDAPLLADLATKEWFQRALIAALAQAQFAQYPATPPQAVDGYNQLLGARAFVGTLLSLCEPEVIRDHKILTKPLNYSSQ